MRIFKVKYVLVFAVAALAFTAYWYYWGSSNTPPGQPPLTILTQSDFNQFKQNFNDAADRARMVLLVSPT